MLNSSFLELIYFDVNHEYFQKNNKYIIKIINKIYETILIKVWDIGVGVNEIYETYFYKISFYSTDK